MENTNVKETPTDISNKDPTTNISKENNATNPSTRPTMMVPTAYRSQEQQRQVPSPLFLQCTWPHLQSLTSSTMKAPIPSSLLMVKSEPIDSTTSSLEERKQEEEGPLLLLEETNDGGAAESKKTNGYEEGDLHQDYHDASPPPFVTAMLQTRLQPTPTLVRRPRSGTLTEDPADSALACALAHQASLKHTLAPLSPLLEHEPEIPMLTHGSLYSNPNAAPSSCASDPMTTPPATWTTPNTVPQLVVNHADAHHPVNFQSGNWESQAVSLPLPTWPDSPTSSCGSGSNLNSATASATEASNGSCMEYISFPCLACTDFPTKDHAPTGIKTSKRLQCSPFRSPLQDLKLSSNSKNGNKRFRLQPKMFRLVPKSELQNQETYAPLQPLDTQQKPRVSFEVSNSCNYTDSSVLKEDDHQDFAQHVDIIYRSEYTYRDNNHEFSEEEEDDDDDDDDADSVMAIASQSRSRKDDNISSISQETNLVFSKFHENAVDCFKPKEDKEYGDEDHEEEESCDDDSVCAIATSSRRCHDSCTSNRYSTSDKQGDDGWTKDEDTAVTGLAQPEPGLLQPRLLSDSCSSSNKNRLPAPHRRPLTVPVAPKFLLDAKYGERTKGIQTAKQQNLPLINIRPKKANAGPANTLYSSKSGAFIPSRGTSTVGGTTRTRSPGSPPSIQRTSSPPSVSSSISPPSSLPPPQRRPLTVPVAPRFLLDAKYGSRTLCQQQQQPKVPPQQYSGAIMPPSGLLKEDDDTATTAATTICGSTISDRSGMSFGSAGGNDDVDNALEGNHVYHENNLVTRPVQKPKHRSLTGLAGDGKFGIKQRPAYRRGTDSGKAPATSGPK